MNFWILISVDNYSEEGIRVYYQKCSCKVYKWIQNECYSATDYPDGYMATKVKLNVVKM